MSNKPSIRPYFWGGVRQGFYRDASSRWWWVFLFRLHWEPLASAKPWASTKRKTKKRTNLLQREPLGLQSSWFWCQAQDEIWRLNQWRRWFMSQFSGIVKSWAGLSSIFQPQNVYSGIIGPYANRFSARFLWRKFWGNTSQREVVPRAISAQEFDLHGT